MRIAGVVVVLLVLAAPAAASAKPLRFAPKRAAPACLAKKKQRPACRRATARRPGWRAATPAVALVPVVPASVDAPAEADAVDAPAAPAEPPAPAPAPAPVPPAPACDPSPWLGVIAEDAGGFRLRLTRTCVPAGTVLFQFRNNDLADHNLWAEGVEPAAAARQVVDATPGETVATASAQLTAGRWRLYCSFDGHEAMSRLVDVTPAG